jgi:hypothetical protein
MTQHTVLTTILASLVLVLPAIIHAAGPSQAGSHSTRCESTYKKKPVPPKQLQAIVESHGQWLEHRENHEFKRADLCQADLRHAKLAGADLERARLEGTLLSQANLSESYLSRSHESRLERQQLGRSRSPACTIAPRQSVSCGRR